MINDYRVTPTQVGAMMDWIAESMENGGKKVPPITIQRRRRGILWERDAKNGSVPSGRHRAPAPSTLDPTARTCRSSGARSWGGVLLLQRCRSSGARLRGFAAEQTSMLGAVRDRVAAGEATGSNEIGNAESMENGGNAVAPITIQRRRRGIFVGAGCKEWISPIGAT